MGRPGRESRGDIWTTIGPQFEQVMGTGRGVSVSDQYLSMQRAGEALDAAWALTVARCCDFGTTAEEARELILAAMHAHASKAVA